jgi:hypothetical protein
MRTVFIYLLLVLTAYVCQTVLWPSFAPLGLHVDLFMILVVHATFTHGAPRAYVLAIIVGVLSDLGLPPGVGFGPLFYLVVVLFASVLWQNLNLQSRRYQAIFLGLCTLMQGWGLGLILVAHNTESAGLAEMARILVWRVLVVAVFGPLLLSGLMRMERGLKHSPYPEEYQQG